MTHQKRWDKYAKEHIRHRMGAIPDDMVDRLADYVKRDIRISSHTAWRRQKRKWWQFWKPKWSYIQYAVVEAPNECWSMTYERFVENDFGRPNGDSIDFAGPDALPKEIDQ